MKRTALLMLISSLALAALAQAQDKVVKTSDLRLTQIAGHELYMLKKCNACHTLGAKAEGKLTPIPNKREDAWFQAHVEKESEIVLEEAKSARKAKRVLKKEIAALTDFLYRSAAGKTKVEGLPDNIRQGAYLGYQNNCNACHKIAGYGKEVGPDLTFVADSKSDREWHLKNLKNPQQFSAESPMPAFEGKLSDEQLGKIIDYLLTLKK